jgi:hypothetical protein
MSKLTFLLSLVFGFTVAYAQQQPPTQQPPAQTPPKPAEAVKPKPTKSIADNIFNFQFHYTYIAPGGDLAKRFGNFHGGGAGILFKTQRNWLFGADASFQFGSSVKENNMLLNLTNSNGNIMNTNGAPADFAIGQRGFNTFLSVGKLFPVSWRNTNSGIVVMAGGGVYYHKINITVASGTVPPLSDNYKKGYDRLCMGPALTQFVGYSYQSHNRYYNFYIGFDCMQAFTQSVRKYNYDTMKPDTDKRLDLNFGLRIGWMIPIYLLSKNGNDEYEFR